MSSNGFRIIKKWALKLTREFHSNVESRQGGQLIITHELYFGSHRRENRLAGASSFIKKANGLWSLRVIELNRRMESDRAGKIDT